MMMSTTAIQEFCCRCGRAIGLAAVMTPAKLGKFHPECFEMEVKPEARISRLEQDVAELKAIIARQLTGEEMDPA